MSIMIKWFFKNKLHPIIAIHRVNWLNVLDLSVLHSFLTRFNRKTLFQIDFLESSCNINTTTVYPELHHHDIAAQKQKKHCKTIGRKGWRALKNWVADLNSTFFSCYSLVWTLAMDDQEKMSEMVLGSGWSSTRTRSEKKASVSFECEFNKNIHWHLKSAFTQNRQSKYFHW